jgi:hypothetical protein
MPAKDAAAHLMRNIQDSAQPVLDKGIDVMFPIVLDGENAWEYYPQSGREFLRQFYAALESAPGIEAVTVSEALERHTDHTPLKILTPGSWIHANFNVWIGAPEDNRAWDYLSYARDFYEQTAPGATEQQRKLAFEELLIAEGSDWNWWYGPEHHSANDSDFDELYRKHLSNIYQTLGATPPEYLAQPIIGATARPAFVPQSAYIHPRITGDMVRYFEWLGAAMYTADQRSGAMHGRSFLLDSVYAGIDENNVYGRLDFSGTVPEGALDLVVNIESWASDPRPRRSLRLDASLHAAAMQSWRIYRAEEPEKPIESSADLGHEAKVVLRRNFEFKIPLSWLLATPVHSVDHGSRKPAVPVTTRLKLRFSLWENQLPMDALPLEGWIELYLVGESDLAAAAY